MQIYFAPILFGFLVKFVILHNINLHAAACLSVVRAVARAGEPVEQHAVTALLLYNIEKNSTNAKKIAPFGTI